MAVAERKVIHRSKTAAVLAHLNQGRSITQLEAISEYGLYRLPVIIQTLRDRGHSIWCEMRVGVNGTRYGRYSMTKPKEVFSF
jgi:hypothetical protein